MTASVRSVEVGTDRSLVTVERRLEQPGPGQVLLEVAYCGICGSDLHFRDVPELFPAGTVPGHELSGRVAELGPGVAGWSVGDRVTVLPFAQCGECERCRAGEEQVCPHAVSNGVGLGTGRSGGYAQRMLVDETMLFALPDEVDDRAGTLVEPLAVAVRALERAALGRDEPVAVLGAGPIGLLMSLVLREEGHERFVLVSRNHGRADRAAALGLPTLSLADAEHGVLEALGAAPACVFECAGTPSAARLAVELVQPLGRVILVGMSLEPLDLAAPPILIKEIDLRGAIAYRRSHFARAIELLASGRIPTGELITGTASLDEAEAMFLALVAPGNAHIKILLEP
jgi:(R,R)-butanediol dehydrogenase / meso-butanediol dehydrogenase / diacetyl reductase